jgi:hypothetical protein
MTKRANCSGCNNHFGGTIDNELAVQVSTLRNMLQLESGTGNPPPSLRNIQAGTRKINIKGDGCLESADKPFTIEKLPDGKSSVKICARSEEQLVELVPHIARALKIPEKQLREQLIAAKGSIIEQRPGAVKHAFSFGGADAIRSMVKSSLVLWSTLVGNDEVRSAPYAEARSFVMNGDISFNLNRTHLDSRSFDDIERLKAAYGPLFNLIYIRSDETGRVIAHFTLYNAVAWQLILAESGGTPDTRIALISNPLEPAIWSETAAEEFDVSFEWMNNPDYSDNMVRSKKRLEGIVKYHFDVSRDKETGRLIDESFKEVGIESGAGVPSEKLHQLRVHSKSLARIA